MTEEYRQTYVCCGYTSYKLPGTVLFKCQLYERIWSVPIDKFSDKVSHGMCKKCGEAAMKDLEEMIKETEK